MFTPLFVEKWRLVAKKPSVRHCASSNLRYFRRDRRQAKNDALLGLASLESSSHQSQSRYHKPLGGKVFGTRRWPNFGAACPTDCPLRPNLRVPLEILQP